MPKSDARFLSGLKGGHGEEELKLALRPKILEFSAARFRVSTTTPAQSGVQITAHIREIDEHVI